MKGIRLSKALASAGVASRRAAEELIFAGQVTVNKQTVLVPQTPVNWGEDEIRVDGKKIRGPEEKLYFVLNKPEGYLCTAVRHGTFPIALDLFRDVKERLFTVGRLDRETTGLLLVTNDGHFANKVIHPRANIEKEYLVKTKSEITHEHLVRLSEGARVDEKWVRPISVHKVRKGTFKIVVKEGRKHEVRILSEKAGLKVVELKRIRIGSLSLGGLPLGAYRELTPNEREQLFPS